MTTVVPLSQGIVAVIDDADAATVAAHGPWHAVDCDGRFYARHWYRKSDGTGGYLYMHTLLTGWPLVDHINGCGTDNRRANLRAATQAQNNANSRRARNNTTGYKGVNLFRNGRYRAYITVQGRQTHLGYFDTAIKAAHVYDTAALAQWGEFARINFPKENVA